MYLCCTVPHPSSWISQSAFFVTNTGVTMFQNPGGVVFACAHVYARVRAVCGMYVCMCRAALDYGACDHEKIVYLLG